MNKVGIVGAGITECKGRWVEATYWDLFQQATRRALADAKMSTTEVDSVVYGIYNDIFEHQAIPESSLTGLIGMYHRPGVRVTNGGATGFYAMRAAIAEVASGMSECVLCIGGEKATDCFDPRSKTATPMVIDTIAKSWDPFYEYPLGATASDSYMQMCMGYNDNYPGDIDDPMIRATIVEMMCRQGNRNPFAQRRDETVSAEQVANSRWIIAPFLRLLEACMYTEGAGAIIFASEKKALEISERTGKPVVWVTGIGAANESYQVGRGAFYKPLDRIVSDRIAVERAYEMAGVNARRLRVPADDHHGRGWIRPHRRDPPAHRRWDHGRHPGVGRPQAPTRRPGVDQPIRRPHLRRSLRRRLQHVLHVVRTPRDDRTRNAGRAGTRHRGHQCHLWWRNRRRAR